MLGEEFVKVDVCPCFLPIHDADLIDECGGRTVVRAHVGESALIACPLLSNGRVFEQGFKFLLKVFDGHFVLGDVVAVVCKEFFRLWFEGFPWGIGNDDVKASALHDLIKLIAPMEGR